MQNAFILLITGASSGIGAALALEYAGPGVTLALLGRDEERLTRVAETVHAKGGVAITAAIDVTDRAAMRDFITAFDARHPLDLVIANAGISAGAGAGGESEAQFRSVMGVNLDGVVNTVFPAAQAMQARGCGQLALISSLAGIKGLPGCPAYSVSKTAVRALGEALRGALRPHGIRVSVVCPGYVETPMTDGNDFPMPFKMKPAQAARLIRRGLFRNRARIAFPRALYWPLWLLACLPPSFTDRFFAALPRKAAMEEA